MGVGDDTHHFFCVLPENNLEKRKNIIYFVISK
jgi:hypothetical protein